jgi:hypothetical protein
MRVWRPWTVAWLGGSVLGVVNGVAREVGYKKRVGDTAADQIAAASLVALLGAYFALLQRRWPIPTRSEAVAIGGIWALLTSCSSSASATTSTASRGANRSTTTT